MRVPLGSSFLFFVAAGLATHLSCTAQIPASTPAAGIPIQVGLARIDSLLNASIANKAFPGAAVVVGRGSEVIKMQGYGHFTYDADAPPVTPASSFDLASLTKVIATTTAAMKLYEAGRLELDAPVVRYLPAFGQNGKDRITVRHLLTHTGGMIPFRPFHRMGITQRRDVLGFIMADSLFYEPGTDMRYSDFDMIVLGLIIERITGEDLAAFVDHTVFRPLGMAHTGFRHAGTDSDPAVVPTELDDYFRHKLMQGEVHDETAFILGGTAGHAGLFSTAEDLARFATMMVNQGRVGDLQYLQPETIGLFTTRVDLTGKHTRALGWDTRGFEGYSSAGQFFGRRSYGHTGFTGTSFWIDPDAGLYVILLTNRVYPTRRNQGHVPVRPALADIAYLTFVGPALPMLSQSE